MQPCPLSFSLFFTLSEDMKKVARKLKLLDEKDRTLKAVSGLQKSRQEYLEILIVI